MGCLRDREARVRAAQGHSQLGMGSRSGRYVRVTVERQKTSATYHPGVGVWTRPSGRWRGEEVSDSGRPPGGRLPPARGSRAGDRGRVAGETERNSLLVIVFIYMFHSAFRPAFVHCAGTLCSELPGSCPLRRSPALSRLRSPRRRERRGDLREVNIDRLGFGLRSRCARFCTSPYHAMYEYSCKAVCVPLYSCSWPPHRAHTDHGAPSVWPLSLHSAATLTTSPFGRHTGHTSCHTSDLIPVRTDGYRTVAAQIDATTHRIHPHTSQ